MPEPHHLIKKKLRIHLRKGSPVWQAHYRIEKGTWHRKTTGEKDLEKAKEEAFKIYYGAEAKIEKGLPAVSRSFRDVAKAAIGRMEKELSDGDGKPSYKDYISVINRLLIPYFKSKSISEITTTDFKAWANWRDEKIAQDQLDKAQQAALSKAKT